MNPITESRNRRLSAPRPARLAFWLVAVATLVNFNHLANMTVGTGWFITIGLTLCCVFLCLLVRIPLRQALGLPGFLIVATLISYLLIGLSVAFVTDTVWYSTDYTLPLRVGLAPLIVVATALGSSAALRRVGVERLLKVILAILAVTCILILATPLLVDHLYTLPLHLRDVSEIASFRFIGTFANPNIAGTVGCYTVALALSLLGSGRYGKFSMLALFLSSAAVILTFSRTALLTLILILLFFLGPLGLNLRLKQAFRRIWLAAVLIVGGVVLLGVNLEHLPVQEKQLHRLMWIFTGDPDDEPMRFKLWLYGLSQIAESPLFGHGLTRFHAMEGSLICRLDAPCGVHNSYLMLWGEAGIIPLTLFLLFFSRLLLWTYLTLPNSVAANTVASWTLVFAVACMSSDNEVYSVWNAFILGLSCALAMHAARESRRGLDGGGRRDRHPLRTTAFGMAPSATIDRPTVWPPRNQRDAIQPLNAGTLLGQVVLWLFFASLWGSVTR